MLKRCFHLLLCTLSLAPLLQAQIYPGYAPTWINQDSGLNVTQNEKGDLVASWKEAQDPNSKQITYILSFFKSRTEKTPFFTIETNDLSLNFPKEKVSSLLLGMGIETQKSTTIYFQVAARNSLESAMITTRPILPAPLVNMGF